MPRVKDQMVIFLQPGELFVADAQFQLRTILGSCVSITLWHRRLCIGAMSHFLLPSRGTRAVGDELDGRYGDEAIAILLRELRAQGVDPSECEAKIFGGGNMFPQQGASLTTPVGQRNGEAARELLRRHRIPVVTESLFGVGHRQIIFDVSRGDVWSRQVRPSTLEIAAEGAAQGK